MSDEVRKKGRSIYDVSRKLSAPFILFYRDAIFLQSVDNSADITEDTRQFAETVDVVMYALSLVPLNERSCLVVVNVEALLDSLSVVVRTAALLLTSSLRTPKFFIKEFCYFLMSCHQHCLGIDLLVQR